MLEFVQRILAFFRQFLATYSRSRTLPRSPRLDLGLSSGRGSGVSSISSDGKGKGVTKGLSSALVGEPLSIVTYSNGFRVTLYFKKSGFMMHGNVFLKR